jgi:hypothetical protein
MLYDGQEPKPPVIPQVGEKLGELDGWKSSENCYDGFSPDCRDHPEGCECVNCSGDCPGDSYMGR